MKSSPVYPPTEGREVLVVEDEGRLRDMLARAVKEMGFLPTPVGTAEAALRAIEQKTYDVVILDLNLPGMSGMEMLEDLRRRDPPTEVIILTGFGDLDSAKRAIHLDVVEFLTKPCALGNLERALDRARKRRLKASQADIFDSPEDEEPLFEREPVLEHEPAQPGTAGLSLEEMEQRHILAVLEKNNGNRSATAAELGISLRKLYYRLGQYQKQGLLP